MYFFDFDSFSELSERRVYSVFQYLSDIGGYQGLLSPFISVLISWYLSSSSQVEQLSHSFEILKKDSLRVPTKRSIKAHDIRALSDSLQTHKFNCSFLQTLQFALPSCCRCILMSSRTAKMTKYRKNGLRKIDRSLDLITMIKT
jgi:hypothetical protein